MPSGVIIALVPSDEYMSPTPDPHVSLGYFGEAKDMKGWQLSILESVCKTISKTRLPYYATRPSITGRATFNLDVVNEDDYSHAYVDLVDWNTFPMLRSYLEEKVSFQLDRRHGFMPHMTVAYGRGRFNPDLSVPDEPVTFKWKSLGLWVAGEKTEFSLSDWKYKN